MPETLNTQHSALSTQTYDYIIAGGGMAGLSLAYYLSKSEVLKDKSILIIDKEQKTKNDRTWCFWEIGDNTFEEIIYRKWNTVNFKGVDFDQNLDIGDYDYKMLRGIDFYEFVLKEIEQNANIFFESANILKVDEKGIVKTDKGDFYTNSLVFDSVFRPQFNNPKNHNLLQHFKGYVIQSKEANFDVNVPVMMNFQLKNSRNECQFMYVLPFDKNTALVEFTLFSEKFLQKTDYDFELKRYIKENLQIADYQVLEEEYGVIPMSDESINEFVSHKLIRIGTAGGYTNPATGYTFTRTQKRLQELVKNMEKNGNPTRKKHWFDKRFSLYASILLNVLQKKRHLPADIFTQLYKQNPAPRIFRFLDDESTFWEEIQIMNSTPKTKFIAAALDILWREITLR